MIVLPSIDLESGRAVKRVRGVKGSGIKLGDPMAIARKFAEHGFKWVHVVDLDGAETGKPTREHLRIVSRLSSELGLKVQFGGGVRSPESAEAVISAGASRVVVGSAWVRSTKVLEEITDHVGGSSVLAAIELRGRDKLVYEAWREYRRVDLTRVLEVLERINLLGYLYTQVGIEGTLRGPDIEGVRMLRSLSSRYMIYSGGVSSISDIVRLKLAGVDGVVIGMAVYSGALRLEELARWNEYGG